MALTRSLVTYQDLIDHLVFFAKGNPSPEFQRDARRAIQSAMDELANSHTWTYFIKQGRLNFDAPQTDGSVEYDHTGNGSGERVLTLTGASWPAWAPYGAIIIGEIQYQVATRISSTVIQLSINNNPGADLSAGTEYTLMRDTYPLPPDLISIDQLYTIESWRRLQFIHWREWLVAHRYNVTSANTPYFYCVPNEAEILTPDGWKGHWELKPGDQVMGYDPKWGLLDKPGRLLWETLLEVHTFPFDGELYDIGNGTLCTEGHRWPVLDKQRLQHVKKVEDLADGDRIFLRGRHAQEKFLRGTELHTAADNPSGVKQLLPIHLPLKRVPYCGTVWCPQTPSGLWMMKQGKDTSITGNTIMGDPNFIGVMSARFYPFPDSAITADFTYRGRSRPLNVENVRGGSVSTSADSATLSGDSTAFTSDHVGSVVRTSSGAIDYPTGLDGANPFSEERVVMSVASITSLTVDRVFNSSVSGVKYQISDPLDVEYGAMLNVFLRISEHEMGIIRRLKDLPALAAFKQDAILTAREADSRTSAPRSVDQEGWWSRRLAYMPTGADED